MGKNLDVLYAKEAEYRNLSYKADIIRNQRNAKVEELAEYEKDDITK